MDAPRPVPPAAPAIPSASLLLMREPADGPPEWLIVERDARLAFAAGACAFPGGRIDAADRAAAIAHPSLDADDAAARIAALRETAEETGIDLRAAFHTLHPLTPFARWRAPPEVAPRRFDTRFYLARLPAPAEPRADGHEIVAAFWTTAAALLARSDEGAARLLFPTRRLLERLALLASYEDAHAAADGPRAEPIEPVRDGAWLRIPKGRGYPVTEERIAGTARD